MKVREYCEGVGAVGTFLVKISYSVPAYEKGTNFTYEKVQTVGLMLGETSQCYVMLDTGSIPSCED